MIIAVVVMLLILLLFVGMPVGFSLGISGVVGIFLVGGFKTVGTILATVPFRSAANYALATVPLFIFMAEVISKTDIVGDLFKMLQKWMGRVRGGLAMATILASAMTGAMSGSSTAAAALMANLAVPEMEKNGYSTKVATGIVTVSGTLAIMIPPSIPLVIYGIATENSIGKLLIAGIIPGLMTTLAYIIGIVIWGEIDKGAIPKSRSYTWKEKFEGMGVIGPFLAVIFMVIGSMYLGFATATEAAGMGVLGSIVVGLAMRRLTFKNIFAAAYDTVRTSSMIFTIIIGAMFFGYFMTMTQIPQTIITTLGSAGLPNWVVIIIIVVIYLILGMLMDTTAILLITLPLVYPLMSSLAFDPIWLGIIITKLTEIGLITPPVGMNAYVVSGAIGAPLTDVFKGTFFLLMFEITTLIILLAFPIVSTWLPSLIS